MHVGITGHRGLDEQVEEHVRALLAEAAEGYAPGELVGVSFPTGTTPPTTGRSAWRGTFTRLA